MNFLALMETRVQGSTMALILFDNFCRFVHFIFNREVEFGVIGISLLLYPDHRSKFSGPKGRKPMGFLHHNAEYVVWVLVSLN